MLNLIITILAVPFLPAFFYGNAANGISQQDSASTVVIENDDSKVLGEASESGAVCGNIQKQNLFPIEADGLVPRRVKGSPDMMVWAGSAVSIDADTGTILYYDNGRKRTQIASLTKLMTAMLVIDNIKDLNEPVTITKEAMMVPATIVGCPTSTLCNSNRMYTGEKVRAIDLLKVMLLNSANDAATALGVQVAGSTEKFAKMMNDKADEMGLVDTHFCTPSGLEIDGHEDECYSSAYDIARIGVASLGYDLIWQIMKIPEGVFYSADGKYMHQMKNTDAFLGNMSNCLGAKTGFTPLAGKSLLLATVDPTGKHKVVSVLLNDENRWEDMRSLVDWAYGSYEWK
ncbi:MAG: D-alanyl-D-alanine carboxypeptidase [Candidatus Moranbacteria bacterium]|nr:D-alanyl-D-alanine carboxypeptidase [Candidatus Moranbacteria bacterium]